MTVDEFVPLLDEKTDRELIEGQLRERPRRLHTPAHGRVLAEICSVLAGWEETRPRPRPSVHGFGTGFLLRRDPDTLLGCDAAVVAADQKDATPRTQFYFEGPPILAVEVIEPWDTRGEIVERVRLFRGAGAIVWEVDPDFPRVSVHRPGREPETFHVGQVLTTEPELPGFRVAVAELFGRRSAAVPAPSPPIPSAARGGSGRGSPRGRAAGRGRP